MVWYCGSFSDTLFLSVFKGRDNMVGGEMLGVMVLSKGEPFMVNVTGTKRFFQAVLE